MLQPNLFEPGQARHILCLGAHCDDIEIGCGGTLLDVTTDVPDSVIMPEVIVPQDGTKVTVSVEGGRPGTGSLFLKGYGAGEITVPVTVSAR